MQNAPLTLAESTSSIQPRWIHRGRFSLLPFITMVRKRASEFTNKQCFISRLMYLTTYLYHESINHSKLFYLYLCKHKFYSRTKSSKERSTHQSSTLGTKWMPQFKGFDHTGGPLHVFKISGLTPPLLLSRRVRVFFYFPMNILWLCKGNVIVFTRQLTHFTPSLGVFSTAQTAEI